MGADRKELSICFFSIPRICHCLTQHFLNRNPRLCWSRLNARKRPLNLLDTARNYESLSSGDALKRHICSRWWESNIMVPFHGRGLSSEEMTDNIAWPFFSLSEGLGCKVMWHLFHFALIRSAFALYFSKQLCRYYDGYLLSRRDEVEAQCRHVQSNFVSLRWMSVTHSIFLLRMNASEPFA